MNSLHYDKISKEYEEVSSGISKKYILDPTFRKLLGRLNGESVVDLACGSGNSSRIVKEAGAGNVVGVDISPGQIKLAKENEKQNPMGIEYFTGDVADFDFSGIGRFDMATGVFLLHYAPTRKDLLRMCENISTAIRSGGRFIGLNHHPDGNVMKEKKYGFSHVDSSAKDGHKRKVIYYRDDGSVLCEFCHYVWRRETYENALSAAGFRNIRWPSHIISEEGYSKFGKGFWKLYNSAPIISGITFEKH
jgi:ubiquinone/menaquinone biosynthesis C-methylase UbiE